MNRTTSSDQETSTGHGPERGTPAIHPAHPRDAAHAIAPSSSIYRRRLRPRLRRLLASSALPALALPLLALGA